jgi:hypothetical protein
MVHLPIPAAQAAPPSLLRVNRTGWRKALSVLSTLLLSSAVHAATCTWQAATTLSWNDPLNWSGCALGGGAPAGTPGPLDRAVLPASTGTAILEQQFITIAELEMTAGSSLGLNPSLTNASNRQLTVTGSVQLSSASLSGALPPPGGAFPASLVLRLNPGATLALAGSNTLRRAVLVNGGAAIFSGGAGARLDLDLNGQYVNELTGITTTLGDFIYGYSSSGAIQNDGHWLVQGPGLAQVQRSGASGGQFSSTGLFEVRAGTFKQLNPSAGFQSSFGGSVRLVNGIFDAGAQEVVINTGRFLSGSGGVIGAIRISGGKLDLDSGPDPIGVLSVTGALILDGAELVLDVDGPGLSQHDRVSVSGPAQLTRLITTVRLAPSYAPGIDTSIPMITHASFQNAGQPTNERVLSDYPLSLALRAQPTRTDLRVVPTLLILDSALDEGNAGTQNMIFQAKLSAISTEVISFSHTLRVGTAVTVATPGFPADFNDPLGNVSVTVSFPPGSSERLVPVIINGDTALEGDEAFSLITGNTAASTLHNASFGNGRRFQASAEGRILNDELPIAAAYLLVGKRTNQSTPTGQVSFIRRYSTTGQAIDGWPNLQDNTLGASAAGFCRVADGDVISTRFSATQGAIRMTPAGAVRDADFGGFISGDESCAVDAQANVWVSDATPDVVAGFGNVRKVSAFGRLLQTIKIPVGERAVDWLELDANQCTLYYTSEDNDVRRFNVCSNVAMTHFATALAGPCYAMRQRNNGELLLACKNQILRFANNGSVLDTYSRESLGETDIQGLFALTLDPDNESFWTAGVDSGRVVRARIDTGAVMVSFLTGTGGVSGLIIEDNFAQSAQILKDGFE